MRRSRHSVELWCGLLRAKFQRHVTALAGDQDAARVMIDEALAPASSLDDPFSLALTLYFTSAATQMLGHVSLDHDKFRTEPADCPSA